jgi:hypothetical protein
MTRQTFQSGRRVLDSIPELRGKFHDAASSSTIPPRSFTRVAGLNVGLYERRASDDPAAGLEAIDPQ